MYKLHLRLCCLSGRVLSTESVKALQRPEYALSPLVDFLVKDERFERNPEEAKY